MPCCRDIAEQRQILVMLSRALGFRKKKRRGRDNCSICWHCSAFGGGSAVCEFPDITEHRCQSPKLYCPHPHFSFHTSPIIAEHPEIPPNIVRVLFTHYGQTQALHVYSSITIKHCIDDEGVLAFLERRFTVQAIRRGHILETCSSGILGGISLEIPKFVLARCATRVWPCGTTCW